MKFHVFPTDTVCPARRAIMLFAGWGMDEKPFAHIGLSGYDLIVVWDYRLTDFSAALDRRLEGYDEIAVIAWSFGVPAATRFLLTRTSLPVTARIAVNGTMHPVDDTLGIPVAIFSGTLEGLSEKSLSKFYLRMCGSAALFREFASALPERGVDELREELAAIGRLTPESPSRVWERAVVCRNDRIIPPANQLNAWRSEAVEIIETDGPHLPDFNSLLARLLTEKSLVAEKFTRAEVTYDDNATVQREISGHLCRMACEMIADTRKALDGRIPEVLEIGCGTGQTTRMLSQEADLDRLEVWDLHIPRRLADGLEGVRLTTRECDAETEIRRLPAGSLDMIFSASTMQWFNSPMTFMRECGRALRHGGYAVISTFGPETMTEICSLLPVNRHYPTPETLMAMIPDGCRLIHFSTATHTVTFPTPADALRHVKLTGVNALSRRNGGNAARTVISGYPLDPDGKAPVTYQPIYMIFQKL